MALISVVTATYNSEKTIDRLGQSLLSQKFKDFEWVVVDGASKDDTLNKLSRYSDIISVLISEPDAGIYDAWNKACTVISGQWVIFIGSDDMLADDLVFEDFSSVLRSNSSATKIIYGMLDYCDSSTGKLIKRFGSPWAAHAVGFRGGKLSLPIHPEVFHLASALEGPCPFDKSYKICGDMKLLAVLTRECEPIFVPRVVVRMSSGGISSSIGQVFKHFKEESRVYGELGINVPLLSNCVRVAKVFFKSLLLVFPASLSNSFLSRIKYLYHYFR